MKLAQTSFTVETAGPGLYEVTEQTAAWAEAQKMAEGVLTVFCRHTSASLVIQENADPAVLTDLEAFFRRLVPEDGASYLHAAEGPDDMPAHIKGALTASSLNVPLAGGRLLLGTWQGIYLFEHRRRPHRREIVLHLQGNPGP